MTFIDWILGFGTICVVATLILILVAILWFLYGMLDDVKRIKLTIPCNKELDE